MIIFNKKSFYWRQGYSGKRTLRIYVFFLNTLTGQWKRQLYYRFYFLVNGFCIGLILLSVKPFGHLGYYERMQQSPWCCDPNIPLGRNQHAGSWCPRNSNNQSISRHDADNVRNSVPVFQKDFSELSQLNIEKCKYISHFEKKWYVLIFALNHIVCIW